MFDVYIGRKSNEERRGSLLPKILPPLCPRDARIIYESFPQQKKTKYNEFVLIFVEHHVEKYLAFY